MATAVQQRPATAPWAMHECLGVIVVVMLTVPSAPPASAASTPAYQPKKPRGLP